MPKLVDLSQELFNDAPRWHAHPPTKVEYVARHAPVDDAPGGVKDVTYASMYIQLSDHGTTHTDSVSHIDARPEAPDIDQIPLASFYTRGIALDFTGKVEPGEEISLELLQAGLAAADLTPPEGGTFLFTGGHYRRTFPTDDYVEGYPGLSGEAGDFLYRECGVFNIGADAPSIDAGVNAANGRYPCHVLCRELQRVNTENLANIEEVAGLEFQYVGFPLKIRNGTAGPVRAVAVLDTEA
jgi:kynurenine formamidase